MEYRKKNSLIITDDIGSSFCTTCYLVYGVNEPPFVLLASYLPVAELVDLLQELKASL
jgi:hypothetical protein